ncbi:quercetin dioxygenase-like cupin family protein [Maribacter spongiicola]|uniref:Quercetin dioxygenase-like cupin family protein n=1 Tax=Maribacter spongiicola TaxID=1206753 RepID=A0A4R7K479_9FLAO|nr:cupin domain-containing protein [Maribacter spongiicola]TDT45356.1 quercetin dioxygenase-like cupin family protein [Maribacter spongiicola]
MKNTGYYTIAILLILLTACNTPKESKKEFQLFEKGTKIENSNFTGTAWLNMLAAPDSLNTMYAGLVTFEPAAHTNWHSHPAGQILIVTQGEGYYQEEGKPKRILRIGETIKCLPNIKHWHGAAPNSEFAHIAISSRDKGPAQWFKPVLDEEYNGI